MKKHRKPQNLMECFKILDDLLTKEEINVIKSLPSYMDMFIYHFGIGMYIRNNWIYGKHNEKFLEDLGYPKDRIFMADHLSGEILELYWFYKQGLIKDEKPDLKKLCKKFDKGKLCREKKED